MTVLGKTLVVINLVFSVVVGALIVMVYATRTNWQIQYKKLEDQYKAAIASRGNSDEQVRQIVLDSTSRIAQEANAYQLQVKNRDLQIRQLQAEIQDRDTFKTQLEDVKREVATLRSEVERRKAENSILEAAAKQRDDENGKLIEQMTKERQGKVTAEVLVNSLKLRNTDLLNSLLEKDKELRTRQVAGTSGARAPGVAVNPPPENVEGIVKEVDREHGLASLTIGSDSGLQEGMTLEVYRPNLSDPGQSRYLGTMRIMAVRAKEAVGRMERPLGPLQVGDRVIGRL